MNRRADFYKTLRHEQPERLIVDFGGNPLSGMEGGSMARLLNYLGYESVPRDDPRFGRGSKIDERILKHFDLDTRAVGAILRPRASLYRRLSDTEYIDEWGIRRRYTGAYWDIVDSPLRNATAEDLDKYPWPDPDSVDEKEIAGYAHLAKSLYEDTDYIVCAEHPVYGVFELGLWMCGFDEFLYRCAEDEPFVHKFFGIVLEYQKKIIRKYYGAVGPYAHYTSSGDDFGTQTGLFVSPRMFRALIAPYFAERIRYTKTFTKAAYLHHSCGSVHALIPDLIDCGVEILNPIQPGARDMEPEKLKADYGDKIVFHGGIDTQRLLPYGTPEEVDETCRQVISAMWRDGGYILAAGHNIQPDVPAENLAAMLAAARKYGVK